ncbi:MAG: DNA (cytosine-5-)-methyltransferase [Gammaproteobacteria bacterium]|nr:DNA (cytosine-5-)-methyltransferase [Gammaproteobacteria bacterium]
MNSAPLTINKTPSLALPIPVADKIAPPPTYTVMELFAGAGGLALGFENAGFCHLLLNDQDSDCCQTLITNRPHWPIKQTPIANLNFTDYYNQIDVVAGGFPCQSFSLLGKRQGFDDPRGRCFFDYVRAIQTVRPSIALAENVKGLRSHNQGKTLAHIIDSIAACGYRVLPPQLLKAIEYRVPQRRERLFIVAIRDDLAGEFIWPTPNNLTYTLQDALKAGKLFRHDTPPSVGYRYSTKRHALLDQVPPGKNWRALPDHILQTWQKQKHYKGSQMAKRLSWEEPCLTLLLEF